MNSCRFVTLSAIAVFLNSCASHRPVISAPPTVRVLEFESTLITPDAIQFQAKIAIHNRMAAPLDIQKVDWGADLFDKGVFMESFTEVHPVNANGNLTVTFPFQIVRKDILNGMVDILAEEAILLSFRGDVFPVGFGPVPFQATRKIFFPKPPAISIHRAEGNPFGDGEFTVFLKVGNPNRYPLGFEAIDSYLEINDKRYRLLRTKGTTQIGPGAQETVALTLEHATGKSLSMAWNIARSRSFKFGVGGSLTFCTPSGLFQIPLRLSSEAAGLR